MSDEEWDTSNCDDYGCDWHSAPVVDMATIMRIENSAVGHVDYTQKLAIRAAELVLAVEDEQR